MTTDEISIMRQQVLDKLQIEVTDYPYGDLSIYTMNTADGYEIWVMTEDHRRLDWENDIFTYKDNLQSQLPDVLIGLNPGTQVYVDYEEDIIDEWVWQELYEKLELHEDEDDSDGSDG